MNERDRIRQEKLDRLFELAGPTTLPGLTPEPGLPARVRERAQAQDRTASRPVHRAPRLAWVTFATAAVALSIMAGGYIGYRAWLASATPSVANGSSDDAEMLMAAWSQSGFVENLDTVESGEVKE